MFRRSSIFRLLAQAFELLPLADVSGESHDLGVIGFA